MLLPQNSADQTNLLGTGLLGLLDEQYQLQQLAAVIPWSAFERACAKHYTSDVGRPAKPIRLIVGVQLIIYRENLSDEPVSENGLALKDFKASLKSALCSIGRPPQNTPCQRMLNSRKKLSTASIPKSVKSSACHDPYCRAVFGE